METKINEMTIYGTKLNINKELNLNSSDLKEIDNIGFVPYLWEKRNKGYGLKNLMLRYRLKLEKLSLWNIARDEKWSKEKVDSALSKQDWIICYYSDDGDGTDGEFLYNLESEDDLRICNKCGGFIYTHTENDGWYGTHYYAHCHKCGNFITGGYSQRSMKRSLTIQGIKRRSDIK